MTVKGYYEETNSGISELSLVRYHYLHYTNTISFYCILLYLCKITKSQKQKIFSNSISHSLYNSL